MKCHHIITYHAGQARFESNDILVVYRWYVKVIEFLGLGVSSIKTYRVNTKTLTELAYQSIKKDILAWHIKPGDCVSEQQLADQLGISRTPVREALQTLARDGLVTIIPRKGTFVREISVEDIVEIYNLREVIEGLAARLAAPLIDQDTLAKLDEAFVDIGELAAASNWQLPDDKQEELITLDFALHDAIVRSCRSPRLVQISETLNDQVQRTRVLSSYTLDRVEYSIVSHREIIDALLKRNGELAEHCVREHIANSREAVVESIIKFSWR